MRQTKCPRVGGPHFHILTPLSVARAPLPAARVSGWLLKCKNQKGPEKTVLITLAAFKWEQISAVPPSWPRMGELLNLPSLCRADMAGVRQFQPRWRP